MKTDLKITELATITVPEWIPGGDSLTVRDIYALSVADATMVSNPIEKMTKYGDSILDYIVTYKGYCGELPDLGGEDWESYCAKIVNRAIEGWAEIILNSLPDTITDDITGY